VTKAGARSFAVVRNSVASIPKQVEIDESSDGKPWIAGVLTTCAEVLKVKKTKENAKTIEYGIDNIASTFRTMAVGTVQEWGIGFKYPFLVYKDMDNQQKKVWIDLLVMMIESENCLDMYNPDGTEVWMYTKMLSFCERTPSNNDRQCSEAEYTQGCCV